MGIDKYYHVNTSDNCFYITRSSVKTDNHSGLATLQKIERILKNNLPYALNRQDEFSHLDRLGLRDLLGRISNIIREGFRIKQTKVVYVGLKALKGVQINLVSGSISSFITARRGLPVQSDIIPLIASYLSLNDIKSLALANRSTNEQAKIAILYKAREVGYSGHDKKEAYQYIKELLREIKNSPIKGAFKGLSLKISSNEIFKLFDNFRTIIILKECKKVLSLLNMAPVSKDQEKELGARALIKAAKIGNKEMIELLLKHRADPNFPIFSENSALSHVVNNWDIESVKLLLEKGAKVDFFALTLASGGYARVPRIEILKLLLEKGGNINAQDMEGNTALHYASKGGFPQIVKLLLEHGADPKLPNFKGHLPNI